MLVRLVRYFGQEWQERSHIDGYEYIYTEEKGK